MFSRRPQLSTPQKREVVLHSKDALTAQVGEFYETSTGLVLKSWLVPALEARIAGATTTLSAEQLAQEFDVSVETIRACLERYTWPIYGPKVLEGLAAKVPSEPTLVLEFCKNESITVNLLKRLEGVSIVGEYVLQTAALDELEKEIKQRVQTTEPITLPSNVLTNSVVDQLNAPGRYDRATRVFTPQAYHQQQRQSLYEKVLKEGSLSAQDLKPFDLTKFSKRFGLPTANNRVYSQAYLDGESQRIKGEIEQHGFFDATGLDIKSLLDLKYSEPVPGIYYKPSPALKTALSDWARAQGTEVAETVSAGATDNSRKLANTLAAPSNAAIQAQIEEQLALDSPKLVAHLVQKHAVATREAFLAAADTAIDAKIRQAGLAVTARISAYLRGVERCEGPLQDALFDEWHAYAVENDPSAAKIASLQQAVAQFDAESTEAAAAILASNLAKLKKAKDAAMVLHLALTCKFSQMYPGAALRFKGKHVPKVLKQFEFPASFGELKSAVTKKEDAKDKIAAVKAAVGLV